MAKHSNADTVNFDIVFRAHWQILENKNGFSRSEEDGETLELVGHNSEPVIA
jgi:hypothetical protein